MEQVQEVELVYSHYPRLREKVGEFMLKLAEVYSNTVFGAVCSRCGECCQRENIFVYGADIFKISHFLQISPELFCHRYLNPTGTWNAYDGYIKLKKGKCPFLKEGASGYHQCSIYEFRPQNCRLYPPMSHLCRKTPGYILESLERVEITGDQMTISVNAGIFEKPDSRGTVSDSLMVMLTHEELLEKLEEIKKEIEKNEKDSVNVLEQAIGKADLILEKLVNKVKAYDIPQDLQEKVSDLRDVLTDLANLGATNKKNREMMQDLWQSLHYLESFLQRQEAGITSPPPIEEEKKGYLYVGENISIKSLSLFPEFINAVIMKEGQEFYYSVPISCAEDLMNRVRDFIKTLCSLESEELATILMEEDPPCYLCGKCCKAYAIEIRPSDVVRIADNLQISESEARQKYMAPHRFSFNPGDATMKKIPMEGGPLDLGCNFLEKRKDGYFYCSIHAFKPWVCRAYSARNPFCREVNHGSQWYRLSRNIIRIDIYPSRMVLHTYYTHAHFPLGYRVDLDKETTLYSSLEQILTQIAGMISPLS